MTLGQLYAHAFAEADAKLSPDVWNGSLDKRSVLATFFAIREQIRRVDPALADQLIPRECEAAAPTPSQEKQ